MAYGSKPEDTNPKGIKEKSLSLGSVLIFLGLRGLMVALGVENVTLRAIPA